MPGQLGKTIATLKLHAMQVWMQTLAPGTAIPPHTHGGEELVMILKVNHLI